MRILFIENDPKTIDRLKILWDNLPFEVDLLEINSLAEGSVELKSGNYDAIFTSHRKNFEGGVLIKEAKSIVKDVGIFLLTDEESSFANEGENIFSFTKDSVLKDYGVSLFDFYKKRNEVSYEYQEQSYKKIRLVYFLRFNKVLCDVYVKINEKKYVKILKKGDQYTRDEIQRYRDKDLIFFYIDSSDYEQFASGLSTTPFLISQDNLSEEDSEDAIASTVEIVQDLVKDFGVNDQVINLVDYSVFQITEQLSKGEDKLAAMLGRFQKRKDFLYDSSYLVAYFSNNICQKMNWDSDETRKKLTYASMLHDVCVENVELAMAHELNLPGLKDFAPVEIEKYRRHPFLIHDLVKDNDKVPMNVPEIVIAHHENPEGTGFPKGLPPHRVSQLQAVFIVSRNFVNELYKIDFDPEKRDNALVNMAARFQKGNYKSAFLGLISLFPKAKERLAAS